MYLKKIEVKGFKSFADRTVVKPAFGVTCVVGPNGSGKSNITDAIRWVLGEQGARVLRGEKMEDIIFSGTGKRGALGFAEVKLLIDNADGALRLGFDEIEIARRLYRSGESEYRINDSPVRLKDIRDLFADTGVGLEGYSIIGQGRIDEIVGASPQDRRLLFDEAAGVTVFKMKKTEAEKQLKAAEEDLREVSIRMEEVEKSVAVLQEEAERAEKYLVAQERVRKIKIQDYAFLYGKTRKLLERARSKAVEIEAECGGIAEERNRFSAELKAHEQQQFEDRNRLRAADHERFELAGRIRGIDTEILLSEEKRHGLEKQVRSLKQRTASGHEGHEKKIAQREELLRETEMLRTSLASREMQIKQAAEEMGEKQEKLSRLKREVQALHEQEQESRSAIKLAEARLHETERMLEELESEHADLPQIEEEQSKLDACTNRLQMQDEERTRAQETSADLDGQLLGLQRELSGAEKELVRIKAELEFHRESLASHSDYEHAVQSIMKRRPDDVLGVVGELFHVDKKYEEAIETALGRNIGILVCEKASTAKKYIDELRGNRAGRVSFLPLEDVRETERLELKEEGLEGVAVDLISCDPRYRSVFQVLLGGILIAGDFESGRRLLRHGKRVVTLKGEVFIPGGIVTGGATARSGKILSRRRMANECEENMRTLQSHCDELREREGALLLQRERIRLQLLDLEHASAKLRIELALMESNLEKERLLQAERSAKYERERARLTEDRRELADALDHSSERLLQTQERLLRETEEISVLEQTSDESNAQLTEAKVEEARIKEQVVAKKKETDRLTLEIEEYQSEQSGLEEEIGRLQAELGALDAGREELVRSKEALLPELERYGERLAALEERVRSAEERGRELSEIVQNLEQQQRRAEDRALKHRTECIRSESELARIQSELLGIYEIGVDEATAMDEVAVGAVPEWALADFADYAVRSGLQAARPEDGASGRGLHYGRTVGIDISESGGAAGDISARSDESAKDRSSSDMDSVAAAARAENQVSPAARECFFPDLAHELAFFQEQLTALSGVNLSAIDEYKSRTERLEHVAEEKKEIVRAIAITRTLIADMAREIQLRFREGLDHIAESFNYAFTRLFGGGEAKLRLIGGEDVLTSGVEIVVQPPGKKLRSISLLSGGEKALTAIALLFAFMEQRPSPFYILDEIEAPLDDVNLIKFTEFLKEYSERAQFLVITHRRATMEMADAIFGVTMEEYGVSKVISTKLAE